MSISIDGEHVRVTWTAAPDASDSSFRRMQDEVDAALLLECVRIGSLLSVSWRSRSEIGISGTTHSGVVYANAYIVRAPQAKASSHARRVNRLLSDDAAILALRRYRDAMHHLLSDDRAAVVIGYLAVEVVAEAVTGGTVRASWETTERIVGLAPGAMSQLYDSMQSQRHHSATRAANRLTLAGVTPLTPNQCLDVVASVITGYLGIRSI